ncbi:MAG TPA: hydroxymyristoyl-ACP dehydratase [Bacteroidales bacterium]|nr:hydroxymyristoyl-ACP dehydratase [Bacteroidales bacterium]HOU01154.1 hydroxymyristoyl-ACP dehydratase [Bacteroidales bacterium]HQG63332.1 hydroxymyristoyl-ACP dehydratase [Bacteroidales bacterium]HQK68869.1 hydroxymyristoyl-ACP dehydratase [Bacteroidales bacterium]
MIKPDECEILDFIPQRPPMVMIDRLDYKDEKSARGSLYINASNIFCSDGFLSEAGVIEFITQTAAAYKGYQKFVENKEIGEGFIGIIRNLVILSLPAINIEIGSEILIEDELLGYTLITGRAFQDGKLIAEGEMRILTEPND